MQVLVRRHGAVHWAEMCVHYAQGSQRMDRQTTIRTLGVGRKRAWCSRKNDVEGSQGRILGRATSRRNHGQDDSIGKQTCGLP